MYTMCSLGQHSVLKALKKGELREVFSSNFRGQLSMSSIKSRLLCDVHPVCQNKSKMSISALIRQQWINKYILTKEIKLYLNIFPVALGFSKRLKVL